MKLMKYTFRTPLFGSISCEELFPDTDGYIVLSPEQMCKLYDHGSELLMFLTENLEDLSSYVPEELSGVILRAEFGDCAMLNGKMYLRTHIWTEPDLADPTIEPIMDWITGQMSDGWGEGLEQRAWKSERIRKPTLYFDEYSLNFEEDEEYHEVSYYAIPWNSKGYEIYLEDCEEVEEDVELKVVATMSIDFYQRQVIKLNSGLALKMFLKDFNAEEFADKINDACPVSNCAIYIVRDVDAPSGIEILPKWVCEHHSQCVLYDHTNEEDHTTTFSITLNKAILELLK